MTTPVSSGSPQIQNYSSGDGGTKDVLVTLSSVKASMGEEVSALLAALGFKAGDVEAFNEKYKTDLRQFLKDGMTKPSRRTKDASPQPGFQAKIRISRHNYDLFTKFIAGRRAASGAVKPTGTNLPFVNAVDAHNSKHGINVGEQNKAKLFRLANQAEIDRTSFGKPSDLSDLKHFSVSVAPGTKAADADKILEAFVAKNFGDTLPFAKSRADVLEIAKGSGVELKNAKVTNGEAEFDLTLESQLKLKIAYNLVRDNINRADAARNETINGNAVSQFTLGIFEGAKGSVEATGEIIADPVGTVKAVWQIVGNPVETFNALYKELGETSQEFKNAAPEQKARMVGKLVGTLVTEILIGKGIGKVAGIIAETKTGAALVEKAKAVKLAATAKAAETFSDEAAALAKQRLAKSGALRSLLPGAIPPEVGVIAGNKIKNGAIKFVEFSSQMKAEFGNRIEPHLAKLYRESLVSLDLSKSGQIVSSSGKAINEAISREAKEKVVELTMRGQSPDVAELKQYLYEIGNKYGKDFEKELQQTVAKTVDNVYEGRRTPEVYDLLGGHTIYDMFDGQIDTKHVGKTVKELRARLASEPGIEYASSFTNLETANRAQMMFVKHYEKDIAQWLKNGTSGKFAKKLETGQNLGKIVGEGKFGVKTGTKVLVTLAKDETKQGWHIVTSFPSL